MVLAMTVSTGMRYSLFCSCLCLSGAGAGAGAGTSAERLEPLAHRFYQHLSSERLGQDLVAAGLQERHYVCFDHVAGETRLGTGIGLK